MMKNKIVNISIVAIALILATPMVLADKKNKDDWEARKEQMKDEREDAKKWQEQEREERKDREERKHRKEMEKESRKRN